MVMSKFYGLLNLFLLYFILFLRIEQIHTLVVLFHFFLAILFTKLMGILETTDIDG